ncbi:MAG TPA: ATP-binding protein [Steroidobacteraceae bacterium]|nr:ATP-binding protein [Steroidobacteraceae bacterium]
MTTPAAHRPTVIEASQWRQIVNGATDTAIISTDPRGLITSWNTGAHRILGWSEQEVLGQTLERIFPEEDRARGTLAREIEEAGRIGRGGGEEGWRLRKDGGRFWAVGELTPIRDGHARIVGFIKILRDRTAQRQSEEQIRDERHALEIQNRAASALAQESDRQRLLQIVTDAGVELSGAEVGAFFGNVNDPGGESHLLCSLSGASVEGFNELPMPGMTEPLQPGTGSGIVRSSDITQDARYRKGGAAHLIPRGHLPIRSYLALPVISRSGGVLGALLFGHSRPGVFGDRVENRVLGLAAEAAVAIDNVALTQELRHLNSTLEQQVCERTLQLKTNEQALRQSQKIEAIGQLTGGVAHDFNNLLQVIIGNLESLRRNLPTEAPRASRAVESAMSAARRGAALTQRLLAFSRRQPLNPKPIDVNALISGMSDLLHRTLGEPTEVVTVRCAALWRVEADPIELEAAILNLALNARDAMPEGGRLTLETANVEIDQSGSHADVTAGQYVSLSVSDTGVGMEEKTLAQAFEPFFTTKPVGRGTGLGLSQVYGFVKQSGGHVKIHSQLGRGTAVRIYLPRLVREDEPATLADPAPAQAGAPSETILVTEDDDDVREYSVEVLRELGYRVIEAHDGPSALRLLERQPKVDLLFTDVVLPGGMTGAQLAAQARGARPGLKVLFTTGYARNAIVHHGRLDKGVQLIAKPFTVVDLGARVRDVLDGSVRDCG